VAYALLIYEQKIIKSGGVRKAFLIAEHQLAPDVKAKVKTAWSMINSENGDNAIFINGGDVKVQEAASTPLELQMNENKLSNAAQIYELFGLSSEIIKGTATDEQIAHAVQNAVVPIISAFESILNRNLLLESEKGHKYFAFDLKELLKGDIEKRYKAYQIALQSNFMQLDEVRYAEDLKPLGFNLIKFGLNDVFYDVNTKTFYTPNTNATANINNGSTQPVKTGEGATSLPSEGGDSK
jgi:HK97 family phage portal protein